MNFSKDKISRSDLKTNDMKRLIVKIDFIGLTSVVKFVEALKEDVCSKVYFDSYQKIAASYDEDSLASTASMLSVSEEELRSGHIHRFSSPKWDSDNRVYLDISAYCVCLEVICKNYPGFDRYGSFIGKVLNVLMCVEPFIVFKRIGLRKISAFLGLDREAIHKNVESAALPNPLVEEINPQCKYSDRFFWERYHVKVNMTRELNSGVMLKDGKKIPVLQVSLDYDVYADDKMIKEAEINGAEDVMRCIDGCLNEAQFELFKKSVTDVYLENMIRHEN